MKKSIVLLLVILPFCSFGQTQEDSTKVHADSLENILINLSADDLESDVQNQDVSSLLQSSRDVFTSVAGYNFSAARYRMRGLQSEHFTVMMNGVTMNLPTNGWAIWAFWGGLNDVTRYPETGNGIAANPYQFGGIGGFSNINLRASRFRPGSRASYALTNRTYRQRLMFTHATGMMKNGWAFAFSASGRYSSEGYVEGTHYNGGSYFASIEKKINDKHSLNLAGFGAPTVQGRSGIALQEAYDLTGSNYYNPYWGYQTSEETGKQVKRNARVRDNHRPFIFLTHDWKIDKKKKLNTTIFTSFGKSGSTNLNWYDANDPRPDYYKYLPSYYEQDYPWIASDLTESWGNDPSVSQLNWDAMYNANYKNMYTQKDVDGISGNDQTFNRSKYIVEEYRNDPFQLGLNSNLNIDINKATKVVTGVSINRFTSHNFKVIDDLLGGDYWVDIDQFSEQDFKDPIAAQNNIDTPNRLVKEGDVFGYNYDIHVNTERAFGQINQNRAKIDWFAALDLSHTQFYRNGLWANGRFQEASKGMSEKQNFMNYGVKAGATYKVTGRHFVSANALYQTKAPYSRNAFISPRTRNEVVSNLESTAIMSGDLNYDVRYPNFRARATVYYSEVNNQLWSRSFYHDEFRNFVNYTMTGVDQLYTGVEVGLEGKIRDVFVVNGAFSTGQFLYNSRPTATITVDNSAELLAEDRTVYLENFRIGGMPQTAASIGVKYNSPKYWYVGASFNYYTDIYLDPNPDRRTEEALEGYVDTDPQVAEIIDQEVVHNLKNNPFFDNNYTLDGYAGVSFKLKDKYLRINANVNNILNNKTFKTGGFEQLRYDANDIGRFPPKYGFMYGTTYFLMVTYLF